MTFSPICVLLSSRNAVFQNSAKTGIAKPWILSKSEQVIHNLKDCFLLAIAKNCLTRMGLTGCNRALFLQGFQS
jgi:hypothetical protein